MIKRHDWVMLEDVPDGDYVLYTDHRAALAEKDKEIDGLKIDLGQWRHDWRLLNAANHKAEERIKELEAAIRALLNFIPDGWAMPLGWNQIVADARKEVADG